MDDAEQSFLFHLRDPHISDPASRPHVDGVFLSLSVSLTC